MIIRSVIGVLFLTMGAAQAGDVSVDLKGVNLSDHQAVLARIQPAAELACGPIQIPLDNRPSVQSEVRLNHRACVRDASARALAVVAQAHTRLARQ